VIPKELLDYYESLVRTQSNSPIEESGHLRTFVTELRDLWEQRVILRELRYRAGLPVCSGEVDCLEIPSSQCMNGEHETCSGHTDSCFLCVPRATLH